MVTATKTVTVTIDGKPYQAKEGATVLDVARDNNIYIPTLCNSEAVAAYGACRLCMVEITTAGGRERLVASCLYPAEEGLKVRTNSKNLTEIRQTLIELLLVRCPDSEVIQDMAKRLGLKETHFPAEDPKTNNKCILCALCARVCHEVVGVSAISLTQRGVSRQLSTPFGEDFSETCIGCASCAYICPTHAITLSESGNKRTIKWPHNEMKHKLVQCKVCGGYWATEKEIQHMAKITGSPAAEFDTCTNCRA